jgi:transposase
MIPSGLIRTEAAMVVQLGELMMILDLHRQGLSITAIARRTGRDPKTVRKYIERGLEPPAYGPRQVGRPGKLAPYLDYLRERVTAFPDLSAVRLTRELRERGYKGAYTAVKRFVAAIRPESQPKPFEVRFETPAGYQAQVDFARFVTSFTDEPGVVRIVWLSRWCSVIPGTSSPASSCIRICRRCCAVTCWPSPPSVACRSRFSTIA